MLEVKDLLVFLFLKQSQKEKLCKNFNILSKINFNKIYHVI
jgi:hypothetical protein